MGQEHRMEMDNDESGDILLVCPTCNRRIVMRRTGGMAILNAGDFFALHTAGNLALTVNAKSPLSATD